MKIKDIVIREDGVTVAGISGDKAKLSTGQEIDAKTLTPDPQHPGQFKMPEMDPNAIKPGAVVSTDSQTSEDYEEEGAHQIGYHSWVSHPDFAPHEHDDEDTAFHKAINFLIGKVHPADMEYHAHHLTKQHQHGTELDEIHHDTIASGNHSVGGDPTDDFINDVRDKDYERAQRQHTGTNSVIGENKALEDMLRIAGLR